MAREAFIDDGYDPDEIYSGGSKDKQGHSTNLRVHVPDPWMAVMGELVSNVNWPEYRTIQHFVRDAIYHRLRWVERTRTRVLNERAQTLMTQVQIEAALAHRVQMQDSHKHIMETMRDAFSRSFAAGDFIGARESIKEVEALLGKMEEPWRSEVARELESWESRL